MVGGCHGQDVGAVIGCGVKRIGVVVIAVVVARCRGEKDAHIASSIDGVAQGLVETTAAPTVAEHADIGAVVFQPDGIVDAFDGIGCAA